MTNVLKVRKENNIAYLTMNRPEKRNALSHELASQLIHALKEAEQDEEVKVIILAGEGSSFCSGGDISMMTSMGSSAEIFDRVKRTAELTKTIVHLEKYVISAVQGHAAGAGFSLMLASDFVIAEDKAVLTCSFGNIGLNPDLGLIKQLTERVPLPLAKEWISTCRPIQADEAFSRGLVNRMVKGEQLLEEATAFAKNIVNGPSFANKMVKYLVNHASEFSYDTSMMQENMVQSLMSQSEDTKEGIQAFLEKRAPNFTGK